MHFKKIEITNFRNLRNVEITLNPRVNVFFGENAQGKTNLLETIYTLTHGRSFRTSDVENLIHNVDKPAEFSRVTALIEKNKLQSRIHLVLSGHTKSFFVNEKKVSGGAISRRFPSVLFSPESLSVIKNSDKERRDLIDELIESVFPEKSKIIDGFKRALKQRNKFLKDLRDGVLEINAKNALYLETLTESYLKVAAEMVQLRLESLQALQNYLEEALGYVLEAERVEIDVDYVMSDQKITNSDTAFLYDTMRKRWLELKTAEIRSGHSLVGPHKHDVRIIFAGKDSRFYCSQGQQRLLILAFKMAQIRLHYRIHSAYPLLLLDDVLSEIDEKKRMKLIEYLEQINAQIFITTTESTVLNYLSRESLSVYSVEKGVIKSDLVFIKNETVELQP